MIFSKRSSFFRNILTLFTGSVVAQGISFFLSPVLSRIYSVEDFGVFALYASIVSILGVIASGRYEQAVVPAIDNKEAEALYKIANKIAFVFALLLYVPVIFFTDNLVSMLDNEGIRFWLYIVPVGVYVLVRYNTLNMLLVRLKYFRSVAVSKTIQTGTMGSVNLVGGIFYRSPAGLVFGQIVGHLSAIVYLLQVSRKKRVKEKFSLSELFEIMKKNKQFPLKNGISSLLNILSNQLPTVLLAAFFGDIYLGLYALVLKVLNMPVTLIGRSISQVFFQRISEIVAEKKQEYPFIIKMIIRLFLLGILPVIIMFLFGEQMFAFVFGEQWRAAGKIASVFSIFYLFRFIYFSISSYFIVKRKLSLDLRLNLTMFTLLTMALFAGKYLYNDFYATIILFSIAGSVCYLLFLAFIIRTSRKI